MGAHVFSSSRSASLQRVLILRVADASADRQILRRLQKQRRAGDLRQSSREAGAMTWSALSLRSFAAASAR